jgi:hypothetical protein
MQIRKALLLIVLIAWPSLAASVRELVLPSGESGFSIRCDNENINACYELAGDVCHRGYEIEKSTLSEGFESGGGAYVGPGIGGRAIGFSSAESKSTSEKGMLIRCKEPGLTKAEREDKKRVADQQKAQKAAQLAKENETNSRFLAFLVGGTLLALFTAAVSQSMN